MKKSLKKNLVVKLSVRLSVKKGGGASLSTLLGSWGIGMNIFKKNYDKYIEGLPHYFKSSLIIFYFSDRSMEFFYKFMSISFLFYLVSVKKILKVRGSGGYISKIIYYVSLTHFLEIIYIKFKSLNLNFLKQGYGSLCSLNLYLLKVI